MLLMKRYCSGIWERDVNVRNTEAVLLFADDIVVGLEELG